MYGWQLEKRKLADLIGYHKNPRQLSEKEAQQLKRSIARFGLADKPIINTDNTIIGGHQRVAILKELGYSEVECWVPHQKLSDEEVEEFCIRLNRNHGQWDWDILANEFDEDHLFEIGFTEYDFPSTKMESQDIISDETIDEYCELCKQKLKKKKNGTSKKRD